VHQPVILWDKLGMGQHRREMLLDGLADVALGLFDGLAVAEPAGNVGGTVSGERLPSIP
jgi:hypothetical protein